MQYTLGLIGVVLKNLHFAPHPAISMREVNHPYGILRRKPTWMIIRRFPILNVRWNWEIGILLPFILLLTSCGITDGNVDSGATGDLKMQLEEFWV